MIMILNNQRFMKQFNIAKRLSKIHITLSFYSFHLNEISIELRTNLVDAFLNLPPTTLYIFNSPVSIPFLSAVFYSLVNTDNHSNCLKWNLPPWNSAIYTGLTLFQDPSNRMVPVIPFTSLMDVISSRINALFNPAL